jgi:hypothetical protein
MAPTRGVTLKGYVRFGASEVSQQERSLQEVDGGCIRKLVGKIDSSITLGECDAYSSLLVGWARCWCGRDTSEPQAAEKERMSPSLVKSGRQKGGQALSESVDEDMCHVLCAPTQREDGKKLRTGVDGQPEPEHVLRAAQPGSQFIHVQMRDPQMTEAAFVQGLCLLACASEKGWCWGLVQSRRPVGQPKGPALRPLQRARRRSGEKGFSDGTGQWCAWK